MMNHRLQSALLLAIVNAAAFNANLAQAFEVGDRAINNAILQPTRSIAL